MSGIPKYFNGLSTACTGMWKRGCRQLCLSMLVWITCMNLFYVCFVSVYKFWGLFLTWIFVLIYKRSQLITLMNFLCLKTHKNWWWPSKHHNMYITSYFISFRISRICMVLKLTKRLEFGIIFTFLWIRSNNGTKAERSQCWTAFAALSNFSSWTPEHSFCYPWGACTEYFSLSESFEATVWSVSQCTWSCPQKGLAASAAFSFPPCGWLAFVL